MAMNYTRLHQGKSRPDLQGVFEFIRLLNTAQRLYNQIDLSKASQADKNKLGLGAFNAKSMSRPDLIYVLSSKIMGYDLKDFYALYGLPVTATHMPQSPCLTCLPHLCISMRNRMAVQIAWQQDNGSPFQRMALSLTILINCSIKYKKSRLRLGFFYSRSFS
ncbi:hypothetical protein [Acinetobacter variabilis]|uniref:hypothetical protein n=1 Tax=Acinetobacter variabilis TaxID=70346 RepID=UPI003D7691DE